MEARKIFKSTVQVTAFSVVAVLLSFATQLAVAYYFGASPERDAYFAALVIPTYISTLLMGSIGFVFLPTYVQVQNEDSETEVGRFCTSALVFSAFVSILVILLTILFSRQIVGIVTPGFEGSQLSLTAQLLVILMPGVGFQVVTNLAGSVLQVHGRFLLPALAPIISGLVSLAAVLVLNRFMGIHSLAYGTLIGSCISCVLILYGVRTKAGFRTFFQVRNSHLGRLIKSSVPLLVTGVFFRLTGVFERGIASTQPAGSISYLGYGSQIMTILATITSSGLAASIYPLLSNAWVQKDMQQLFYYFHKSIRVILLITLPISVVFILWGDILVGILFERGAFDHTTTLAVYKVFSILVFAFVANCLGNIVVKIFYLSNNTVTASFSELAGLLFYLVPAFLLSKAYGYVGMAAATSIGAILSILLSFVLVLRILKQFQVHELASDLFKISVSLGFASLVAYVFYYGLTLAEVPGLVGFFFALFVLAAVYFLLLKYFRIEEASKLQVLYKTAYEKVIG